STRTAVLRPAALRFRDAAGRQEASQKDTESPQAGHRVRDAAGGPGAQLRQRFSGRARQPFSRGPGSAEAERANVSLKRVSRQTPPSVAVAKGESARPSALPPSLGVGL